MSATIKRPWHMFYPLAGMIMICIVWSGYWYVAFTQTRKLVAEQRTMMAARGIQFNCNHEAWGGYPFRFEFQCNGMRLKYAGRELQTGNILAIAQAYNPFHVLFLVRGPTSILEGERSMATATHDDALVSIIFSKDGTWDASSDVAHVDVQQIFTGDAVKLYARRINGSIELAGSLSGGEVVSTLPIDTAEFKAKLENDTVIDLTQFKITSGITNFDGAGKLSLDATHRVAGKLSTQTNDLTGLVKLLAPVFQLSEADQIAIQNLIVAQNPNPDSILQKADFVGRDGTIFWGLFKLTDTAPLY